MIATLSLLLHVNIFFFWESYVCYKMECRRFLSKLWEKKTVTLLRLITRKYLDVFIELITMRNPNISLNSGRCFLNVC